MARFNQRITRFVPTQAYHGKSVQRNIQHQLGRVAGRIVNDVDGLVIETAYKSMNMMAPKVVYSIAQGRGFNSYSGALAYAYGASLTVDGMHLGNYVMEDGAINITPPPSTIRFSKKRNRPYAMMQGRRKHSNVSRYIRIPYTYKRLGGRPTKYKHKKYLRTRYLKRYESIYGYHKGLFKKNLSAVVNYVPYKNRTGNSTSHNFYLQVYNVAPYAAMVQAAGYDVISGGNIRGRARNMRRVVANVTAKMIEKAIHNYKKDYSRSHTSKMEISSADYGRPFRPGVDSFD